MTIWNPTLERCNGALYIALADQIETAIENGVLSSGEKLPTQRKLADTLRVTVGTITRGYAEAERRGLIHAVIGSGTFVGNPQQEHTAFRQLSTDAPEQIDLGLNLPVANQAAPGLADVLQDIGRNPHALTPLLHYQQGNGILKHREWAASWLEAKGVHAQAGNLTITCGGQHALGVALAVLGRAGDSIAAEGLTYPGLKAAANQQGLKVVGLAMDSEGVLPEAFAHHCQLQPLRALYLCPSMQNPTNASMGIQRRREIIRIAVDHGVYIIEDNIPANSLDNSSASFVNLAPEYCFYIDSHSKSVAPGLRVGYLLSPETFVEAATTTMHTQCWFAPTLNVEVAQRWLDRKASQEWLQAQKQALHQRRVLAEQILQNYDLTTLVGSFHVWLKLPEPWRASEFQALLLKRGVRVLSAESFAIGRFAAPQAIRICLSGPATIDILRQGLERIRQQLDEGYEGRFAVF